jgi:WD40 repeat protein
MPSHDHAGVGKKLLLILLLALLVMLAGCTSTPKGVSIIATRTARAFFVNETPARPSFPTIAPFKTAQPGEPIFSPTPTRTPLPTLTPTPTLPTIVEPGETTTPGPASATHTSTIPLAKLPTREVLPFEIYPTLTPVPILFAPPTPVGALPLQPIGDWNLDTLEPVRNIGYGQARHAAILPGSNQMAVATTAGVAWFALPTMQHLRFHPFEGGIERVVFSHDGRFLAATQQGAGGPQTLLLRSADIAVLAVLEGGDPVFRPDAESVATTGNNAENAPGTTWLWSCPDGARQATLVGSRPTFSPTGHMLATVEHRFGENPSTLIWRSNDGALLHGVSGRAPAFSPDGEWLATATATEITLRNLFGRAGENPVVVAEGVQVRAMDFSRDGRLLMIAASDGLHIWQVLNDTLLSNLAVGGVFGESGELLVRFLGGREGMLRGVQIARATDGKLLYENEDMLFSDTSSGGATSRGRDNERHLISISSDVVSATMVTSLGLVRVVNLHTGATMDLPMPGIDRFAFSPNGQTLATASSGPDVQLWPLSAGGMAQRGLRTAWELSVAREPQDMSFTPDGHGLVIEEHTGASGAMLGIAVTTWDVLTDTERVGQEIWHLGPYDLSDAHHTETWAFSAATRAISWLDSQNQVRLQQSNGITLTLTEPGNYSALAFSPDGSLLAVGTPYGTIQILKTNGGYLFDTLSAGRGVAWLDFSRDNTLLRVHRDDGLVQVWRVGEQSPLVQVVAPPGSHSSLSPNSQMLIVASSEGVSFHRLADSHLLYQLDIAADHAAISPAEHILAVLHGRRVSLWGIP